MGKRFVLISIQKFISVGIQQYAEIMIILTIYKIYQKSLDIMADMFFEIVQKVLSEKYIGNDIP